MRRVLLAVALLLPGCAGAETYPYYHSGEAPPPKADFGQPLVETLVGLGNSTAEHYK
jgi:hypothetical protein